MLKVLGWKVENGVTQPQDITARHIRAYLADLTQRGVSDSYVHIHARTIQTMLLFFCEEKYIPERVFFKMPTNYHSYWIPTLEGIIMRESWKI